MTETENKAPVTGERKKSKIGLIIGAGLVLVVALVLLTVFVFIPGNKYRGAQALLDAGEYDAAAAAFAELAPYRDSAERIKDVRYSEAEAIFASGDYDGAAAAFEALGSYSDAAERVREVRCAKAEKIYSTGDKYSAIMAFNAIEDHAPARERSLAIWAEITDRDTISAGAYHSVALKEDGTALAVGDNDHGQCDVSDWTDIVSVSAGFWHTLGLRSDGTALAVGDNDDGQCDVSDWTDIVAISAGDGHSVGLRSDGTVVAVGEDSAGQCRTEKWRDIIMVSAGSDHTLGLKADGTVVAAGYNWNGECDVSGWTDIVSISAGLESSFAVRADGTVLVAGNIWDQSDVDGWRNMVAVSSGYDYAFGLKANGQVLVTDCDEDEISWWDIVDISAFEDNLLGLRRDGTVEAIVLGKDLGQGDVEDWTGIRTPQLSPQHEKTLEKRTEQLEAEYAAIYADGEACLASGDYGRAIDLFTVLEQKGYKDAAERNIEAFYRQGESYLAAGEYDKAIFCFGMAAEAGYEDAAERVNEANYAYAESCIVTGDYDTAYSLFERLADAGYRDSAERIKDVDYAYAESCIVIGDYDTAYSLFERLADAGYKDSAERIKDVDYAIALDLKDAGEYEAAIAAFEALGGHRDSAEQIDLCKQVLYNRAIDLLEADEDQQAYELFEYLGDYSDSAEYLSNFVERMSLEDVSYDDRRYYDTTVTYTYDDSGNILRLVYVLHIDGDKSSGYTEIVDCVYDRDGNLRQEIHSYKEPFQFGDDANTVNIGGIAVPIYSKSESRYGSDTVVAQSYVYDDNGYMIADFITTYDGRQDYNYYCWVNEEGELLSAEYPLDQMMKHDDFPKGYFVTYVVDADGNKLRMEGRIVDREAGVINDEIATLTEYIRDEDGQCIEFREYTDVEAGEYVPTFNYYENGVMVGQQEEDVFDFWSFDPDAGLTGDIPDNWFIAKITYDDEGRKVRQNDYCLSWRTVAEYSYEMFYAPEYQGEE